MPAGCLAKVVARIPQETGDSRFYATIVKGALGDLFWPDAAQFSMRWRRAQRIAGANR
jgi:hypothetical protein